MSFRAIIQKAFRLSLFSLLVVLLMACESRMIIINDVEEREANEIVVFLASKGISCDKQMASSNAPGGAEGIQKWTISVDPGKATEAMAILNQNGLPRKKGTNLLDLFAKSGLMSSDKEENIRYQAGLAEQIANMIRKIDGVIDADVQLSFPQNEGVTVPGNAPTQKITAAVYVKHQGILDDPNSHLVIKIKRLVAGSVTGLELNDVTVISDRSRFTDVTLAPTIESLEPNAAREYVSIWSIVLNKESASRFRVIFFFLIAAAILFALLVGWLIWKFYPVLKKQGGFKNLLKVVPLSEETSSQHEIKKEPPENTKP